MGTLVTWEAFWLRGWSEAGGVAFAPVDFPRPRGVCLHSLEHSELEAKHVEPYREFEALLIARGTAGDPRF